MSEHLKELEVIVEDPRRSPYRVHETMFITKTNTKGHGTCRGDSGGPVVLEKDGTWYLEGVHSWGRPSCAQEGYYDGQADVRTVLKWIKDTMSNN
ncbi:CUB and peptidase domain-containing protein 2-like [Oculina patagonica]